MNVDARLSRMPSSFYLDSCWTNVLEYGTLREQHVLAEALNPPGYLEVSCRREKAE